MHFDAAEIAYVPTTGVRRVHETPLVEATDDTLQGYGCLVDEPQSFAIEIVRWPAQGWRAIDENSAARAVLPKECSSSGGKARRLRPQQRRRRQLPLRLEQLAGRGGHRGSGKIAATSAGLARQLPSR